MYQYAQALPARAKGDTALSVGITLADPQHLVRDVVVAYRRRGTRTYATLVAPAKGPRSLYAETKLTAEKVLLGLRDHGLRPVILRLASLFGWSRRPRRDLAVNAMTLAARQSGRIRVDGDGSQWRPFAHVRDAERVVAWAAVSGRLGSRLAPESPIVNLGGPLSNHRVREVAEHAVPEAEVDVARTAQPITVNYHVDFARLTELRGGETPRRLHAGRRRELAVDAVRREVMREALGHAHRTTELGGAGG